MVFSRKTYNAPRFSPAKKESNQGHAFHCKSTKKSRHTLGPGTGATHVFHHIFGSCILIVCLRMLQLQSRETFPGAGSICMRMYCITRGSASRGPPCPRLYPQNIRFGRHLTIKKIQLRSNWRSDAVSEDQLVGKNCLKCSRARAILPQKAAMKLVRKKAQRSKSKPVTP